MNENVLAGMRCPDCGNTDNFDVTVTATAKTTDDGSVVEDGDHEWDDDSACVCPACDKTGVVSDFKFKDANLIVLVFDKGKLKNVLTNGDINTALTIVDLDQFRQIGQEKEVLHNIEVLKSLIATGDCNPADVRVKDSLSFKELMQRCSETILTIDADDYDGNDNNPDNVDTETFVPIDFNAAPVTPPVKPNPNHLP